MDSAKRLTTVPLIFLLFFFLFLTLQILFELNRHNIYAAGKELPPAPAKESLSLANFGEPIAAAKLMMLWLQAFDNQPGISIPFSKINYDRLQIWLERIISLDEKSQYPLLAASRIYTQVTDKNKLKKMLLFVARKFEEDPAARWPWMAHAAIVARHRLQDKQLSLKLANQISEKEDINVIPSWAKQMKIFLLENMGEHEAAAILLGGLIESDSVSDKHELQFLKEQLTRLKIK